MTGSPPALPNATAPTHELQVASQPDLFLEEPQRAETPLVGLRVELTRTKDVPCAACGETVVVIGLGAGPHVASLHCASCHRHRGWLPKTIVAFLTESISRFGWPSQPIVIRNFELADVTAATGAAAVAQESAPMKT
jgi:hypothetical protein